jgi:hypothetical protein
LIEVNGASKPAMCATREANNSSAQHTSFHMASLDLFEKWRIASRAADAATKATFEKSILALQGDGEPPTEDEAEEVRVLRGIADDLFELALARTDDSISARRVAFRPEMPFSTTFM